MTSFRINYDSDLKKEVSRGYFDHIKIVPTYNEPHVMHLLPCRGPDDIQLTITLPLCKSEQGSYPVFSSAELQNTQRANSLEVLQQFISKEEQKGNEICQGCLKKLNSVQPYTGQLVIGI